MTTTSQTFRSLRHRNFRLWFIGQGISLIGTWMQTMAQQLLVYRLTGAAVSLGIISFLGLIPFVLFSLLGGSISDRFPKRWVILVAQTMMLVQALILSYLTWTDQIQVWHVYVLATFLGIGQAIDSPARQSFTVDMVEGKEDLANAIGLNSALFNGGRAVGPAVAGIVVAAVGEGPAFLLNALSFVAVIVSLFMMHDLPQSSRPPHTGNTLAHMAGGIRYVMTSQTLLVLMSMVAISAFLSMPYSTLMPVFGGDVLRASAQPVVEFLCGDDALQPQCENPDALPLGMLMTMVGIGAVIGSLTVASLSENAHKGRLLTVGNLGFPLVLFLFSLSRSFLFSLVILLLAGFTFVWQNALVNTMLQLSVEDDKRGRVMGIYTLSFQVMMRVGGLQAGFMTDSFGAPFSVGIGSVLSIVYGLFVTLRYPRVRGL